MSPLPFRRALLVANPVAGCGRGRAASEQLSRALTAEGMQVELYTTSARGDARARSERVEPGVDLVVSIGGDGTLSEVLSGLPRRDLAVAVLPLGTANVLRRDLRLAQDVPALVEQIRAGTTRALDVARVGERRAFLAASAGFDACVVRELERRRRAKASRATWVPAAIAAWRAWEAPRIEIEVDGARVPGSYGMVLVANVVHYAGWRTLSRASALDDGRFEAYLFPARTRIDLLRHAVRALAGRLPGGSVRRVQGARFVVTADRAVPVQIDGDLAGETPFELAVERPPFRVIAPPIG